MQLENLSDTKVYKESRKYTLKKPSPDGHATTEDDFQTEVQIYNDQKGTLNENNEKRSDSNKKNKTKKQLNYEPVHQQVELLTINLKITIIIFKVIQTMKR